MLEVALPPAPLVRRLVEANPGSDKHRLVRLLRDEGYEVSPSVLNSTYLYAHALGLEFNESPNGRRFWFASEAAKPARSPEATTATALPDSYNCDLYAWQKRALTAWRAAGRRGVVEAVTGAGKTRLALAAAADELAEGGRVGIVVPTIALQDQWVLEATRLLSPHLLGLRIGRMGDGRNDWLGTHEVVVATAQTASGWELLPPGVDGLLIADECHHYGAPTWQLALEHGFTRRLGLTATYEREDRGVEEYLDPYFGGVQYSIGYEEALRDGVIADFKIAFIGVPFAAGEQMEYDEVSERLQRHRRRLVHEFGCKSEPFGVFLRDVHLLRQEGTDDERKTAARYLSAFTRRRALVAGATAKYDRLRDLAVPIRSAERTMIFAQTRDAAGMSVSSLDSVGIRGEVLDATMDVDDRRIVFADFEDGKSEFIAAPRLLDEGINVPAADLAIVLASCRTRRQMIQRMGRVVRPKPDGRMAHVAILYVEGSFEDPNLGAHESFMDLVMNSASGLHIFSSRSTAESISAFLAR